MGRETTEGGKSTPRWTTKAGAVSQSVRWLGDPKLTVRPSARPSVPPACTKRRRRWRALSQRVQPTSLARATAATALPTDRPTDRPTNGRGRLAAAQKPAAQAAAIAAAATKWGAIPSPLSQPASLAAGERERGEGRGTQSTVAMQMADQASKERAKTDAACWLEGGREGGLHTVVVCYGRARSFASPLARLYGVDDGTKRATRTL